jgi:hypothetical protein
MRDIYQQQRKKVEMKPPLLWLMVCPGQPHDVRKQTFRVVMRVHILGRRVKNDSATFVLRANEKRGTVYV